MLRLCPRCEQPLPPDADGSLLFCAACGAPQVRISEQLMEEAAQRRHAEEHSAEDAGAPARSTTGRDMLRAAGLMGGVAAGLSLAAMLLPPVGLLLWLWVVGTPVIALGLYLRGHRDALPDAGFGARLGFLSGLSVALALAAVDTVSLLLARFALHRGNLLDGPLAAVFTQVRGTTEAQYGAAAAAPFTRLLAIPEFRAGLLLSSVAMFAVAYLVLATAGGAFAGLLRRRPAES